MLTGFFLLLKKMH